MGAKMVNISQPPKPVCYDESEEGNQPALPRNGDVEESKSVKCKQNINHDGSNKA